MREMQTIIYLVSFMDKLNFRPKNIIRPKIKNKLLRPKPEKLKIIVAKNGPAI